MAVDRHGRRANMFDMAHAGSFWDLLDAADSDPLTTRWERRFLASLRAQIAERGHPWLSEEQSRVLARLALKIGVPLPAAVQELVDTPERRDLMAIALDARGDPRLTFWEEGFLVSVAEAARIARPLSAKQRAVLAEIAAKVAAPLPDPAEDAEEMADSYLG